MDQVVAVAHPAHAQQPLLPCANRAAEWRQQDVHVQSVSVVVVVVEVVVDFDGDYFDGAMSSDLTMFFCRYCCLSLLTDGVCSCSATSCRCSPCVTHNRP